MSDAIISVEDLGKKYTLRHAAASPSYTSLRDVLASRFRQILRQAPAKNSASTQEEFWALQDVSFEVKQGEVLGIIGRNGAGKSTLLKILSRITEPTKGRITLKGRVASLLEVGTGFHPELTGRENIFLNGAILGMTRAEITKKFDEIVAFAEVERFLDTPVKHYSSGMYVRLAFAVAAHLEPEILIVDEVLAVGDAEFQKKCLGKMENVASREGRTVLMVSHNMTSMLQLCSQIIVLGRGKLVSSGTPADQVREYLKQTGHQNPIVDLAAITRPGYVKNNLRFVSAQMHDARQPATWQLSMGHPLHFSIGIKVLQRLSGIEMGVSIFSNQGVEIVSSLSSWSGQLDQFNRGTQVVRVEFPAMNLMPGVYSIALGARSTSGMEDHLEQAFEIEVIPDGSVAWVNLSKVRGALAIRATFLASPSDHSPDGNPQ